VTVGDKGESLARTHG